jgi:hypothetical protein
MPVSDPYSLARFANLPAELRLQIWSFYFNSPRIHVLHATKDANTDRERILLACTTLDAQINRPVSPRIRTDICREAREVALLSLNSRERIGTLTAPVSYEAVFRPVQQGAPTVAAINQQQQQEQERREQQQRRRQEEEASAGNDGVDVDWDYDLIYLCSPASAYPFMSLARRSWASKVQRLAVALPWQTPSSPERVLPSGGKSLHFNGELLSRAMQSLKALREISVVSLPPLESTGQSEAARAASPEDGSVVTQNLTRSAFGFVGFADYMRRARMAPISDSSVDMTRVSLALKQQLRELGRQHYVAVTKVVDADCCRLGNGEYQRRRRGVPQ